MHEAKGLAAFPPVQTFSEVCGAQCVPELSRLVLPWQRGKEQRCLGGRAGQQHAEAAPRRSRQLPISSALSKAYTTQWRVLTHWGMLALGCKYVLLVSPKLLLIKALGWPLANSDVMVPCWTKANTGDEQSSWLRSDVLSAGDFSDL